MKKYNPKLIETRWQKIWEKQKLYVARDDPASHKATQGASRNFYKLVEFPYPSGNLHMGHWYSYSVPDMYARYKKMRGYNVLFPFGYDAFGLPAENAAIKNNVQPADWTKKNIAVMTKQMKSMGAMFDWSRMVSTIDPNYYRWTQWIFLQFYKAGLAYRAKTLVNWCPKDKTVLANEQVLPAGRQALTGTCERCGTPVEQHEREQWMYRVTKYAQQLLDGLERVDWPEVTKTAQRNWIGKNEGAEIKFQIKIRDLPPGPLPEEGGGTPGYVTSNAREYQELYGKALEMRQHPTQAEAMVWDRLRANQEGHHFRRQHIIDHFIVDFLCLRNNLIVEVDGDIHDDQKERDQERDGVLRGLGFAVLRFRNEEVITNIENVIKKINAALSLGEVSVFTTRPDTLFGATYLVLAPEHELISRLNLENAQEIQEYIEHTKRKTPLQRQESKEKIGVELQGIKAINPATKQEIPVWVADYVLGSYGTGAIMAVPAHDERDFEFAKKYKLLIKEVVARVFGEVRKDSVHRDGVAAVITRMADKKILVLYNKLLDEYRLPAGGYEKNEDSITTLKREILEESGYVNFKIEEYLGQIFAHHYALGRNVWRNKYQKAYHVILNSEESVPLQPDEHEDFERHWMESDEAIKKLDSNENNCFESEHIKRLLNQQLQCYSGQGILINSGKFDGMDSEQAKWEITKAVGGKRTTTYRLRDWILSRQRYWGTPIPMINCEKCGYQPVAEEELPVKLPKLENYLPADDGSSPLARAEKWVKAKCPNCGGEAKRETDTMDTFVDSSWYFLRYTDPENKKEFASKEQMKKWLPVDLYTGGAEHNTMHLLYSRFFIKALHDLGLVDFDEPFTMRRNHGIVLGPDGQKMSKSKGNVIDPDKEVAQYGADTVRMFLAFLGPYDTFNGPWDPRGILGIKRFLDRVWKLAHEEKGREEKSQRLHQAIKKVGDDIERLHFNTAISELMKLLNERGIVDEPFLKLLAPFAPHMTEELWSQLGHKTSIHIEQWPIYDPALIKEDMVTIAVQINGKTRATISAPTDSDEAAITMIAKQDVNIAKYLDGATIKKVIIVKNKLMNFVLQP